jgi:hypothetical protein
MSQIAQRLPAAAWTNRLILGFMGRAAGPAVGAGQVRLLGAVPNGQRFMIAPTRFWAVTRSRAVLRSEGLGPVGRLRPQACLADFRAPQRGFFVVVGGHLENFDPSRHHAVGRTVSIG